MKKTLLFLLAMAILLSPVFSLATDTLVSPNEVQGNMFLPPPYDCLSYHGETTAGIGFYMHAGIGTASCSKGRADGWFYRVEVITDPGNHGAEFFWLDASGNDVKLVFKFVIEKPSFDTSRGHLYTRVP